MSQRRPELVTRTIDGDVVILDRKTGSVHQLNATASQIWNACDGTRTASDIAADVAASFGERPETVLGDVLGTLADFQKLGLLVGGDESPTPALALEGFND